jgi:hypothetical protein
MHFIRTNFTTKDSFVDKNFLCYLLNVLFLWTESLCASFCFSTQASVPYNHIVILNTSLIIIFKGGGGGILRIHLV